VVVSQPISPLGVARLGEDAAGAGELHHEAVAAFQRLHDPLGHFARDELDRRVEGDQVAGVEDDLLAGGELDRLDRAVTGDDDLAPLVRIRKPPSSPKTAPTLCRARCRSPRRASRPR
jgi:hypothetical protein